MDKRFLYNLSKGDKRISRVNLSVKNGIKRKTIELYHSCKKNKPKKLSDMVKNRYKKGFYDIKSINVSYIYADLNKYDIIFF